MPLNKKLNWNEMLATCVLCDGKCLRFDPIGLSSKKRVWPLSFYTLQSLLASTAHT